MVLLWGNHASAVHNGMTLPGPGYSSGSATLCEFAMTFAYVLLLLCFVSSRRLMRWTPLMSWIVVALLVCVGARISGTSLNAARSFGPALISWNWRAQWIYLIAPASGGLAGAAVFSLAVRERAVITAKLYRVPEYRSIFRKPSVEGKTRGVTVLTACL
ncbi:MAG: aquaporin [Chthoniobacterales bacterium]